MEIYIILDIMSTKSRKKTKGNRERGKHIEHVNKKTKIFVKHVIFSAQIAMFYTVSEIVLWVRENSGNFFHSNVWQP